MHRLPSNRRRAGTAFLFAVLACTGLRTALAESSGTAFWVGCYRLTFGDDASKTRDVRLTDVEVPARPGSFAVESVPASDADLASVWRPMGATSFRIGMSNGRTGWSAELKAADGAFTGASHWVDDAGKSGAGYVVTATSIPCAAGTTSTPAERQPPLP